jgi:hypothetical protein
MSSLIRRGVSLAVILFAGPLHAAPPVDPARSVRLVYARGQGAEQCPAEPAVRRAVARRLGYDPFRADAPRTVTATLDRTRGALRAHVELLDADSNVVGSRHLKAALEDCDELVAAMALAIAIAVDPESQLRPPPPSPPATSPPAPSPTVAPAPLPIVDVLVPPPPPAALPLPSVEAPLPAREPVRVRAGLAVLGAAGLAPHVTGGLSLTGGIRWQWLSAALEGRADLPASRDAPLGGTVNSQVLELTLVPCFHRGWLLACALGSVGVLRGAGSGIANARVDHAAFGAMGVRLGGEVPIGRILALTSSADFAATAPRIALHLRGREVWITAPASGTLRLGMVAHFW